MQIELERLAEEREKENKKYKETFKEPIPDINYEAYKQRIANGEALKDEPKKHGFDDPEYQKFKLERMKKSMEKPIDHLTGDKR